MYHEISEASNRANHLKASQTVKYLRLQNHTILFRTIDLGDLIPFAILICLDTMKFGSSHNINIFMAQWL